MTVAAGIITFLGIVFTWTYKVWVKRSAEATTPEAKRQKASDEISKEIADGDSDAINARVDARLLQSRLRKAARAGNLRRQGDSSSGGE